jgi:hypothetical protein
VHVELTLYEGRFSVRDCTVGEAPTLETMDSNTMYVDHMIADV